MADVCNDLELPALRTMLERIDLDLLYLLYDTKFFQDRRLASIADKIETASLCIAMAVEALRAVGSEPAPAA